MASTTGNRAVHAGFGLVVAAVLVTLVISFRGRPPEGRGLGCGRSGGGRAASEQREGREGCVHEHGAERRF